MAQILVKIEDGKDGKIHAEVGIAFQMRGVFRGGVWEQMGRRKVGKKFIEGVCRALVKEIGPELHKALKQEQHYYEHPEDIPAAPQEMSTDDGPDMLTRAADPADAAGDAGEGAEGNSDVPQEDQKPDISD